MNKSPIVFNAASIVAQSKKDRAPGLGRGPETDCLSFKRTIYCAAGQFIPGGKFRKKRPYLTSKMPVLQPLIAERRQILKNLDSDHSDTNRIKLNRVNAQLKKMYAQIKRDSKEQPQFEKCYTIQSTDGLLAQNDEQAANILGEHYQFISGLNFTGNDKYAKTLASNVVHGCRSNPHMGPAIFSRAFSAQELDAAVLGLNLNTSPGPDGIEKVISNDREIGIFADDIVLWSSGSDTEKVEESGNLALVDAWSFAANHKLSLSASNSTEGFFTTNRKLYNFRPRILLNKHHNLSQIIDPFEGLDGVYFHVDLSIQVSKQKELPCYLKQLALERINTVHKDAVPMYTDGSKLGSDCSGSGIYISFQEQEIKIQRKTLDSCSVFRYALVAILEGLNSIESLPQLHDVWIFSVGRSALQHLANWRTVRDRTGADILKILKRLSLSRQWIPSHVNITGNKMADSLTRTGAGETTTSDAPLTYLELFSKHKVIRQFG
ncbi:RNase H domain-containing protein [Trichonephila clavipes]|uniref:RNase H domain-containing protein n=1 Tax=Trichonephila clavipes TaxID=2585209 RepID=A0A8X6RTL7_TRICX|nr:RNase H domain-containing protein [Trichonephila clavipes]